MRKYLSILTFLCCVVSFTVNSQEEEKNFGIKFSGYVKNDVFFDSRQTVAVREGHFLLWPAAESLDENGKDINAKSGLNMLALQSRLTGKISGPDAFGAKTSGLIEADFFAQADANINLLRLRHAFIKLNWENTELITGQTWNPMFVTSCFPGTVSFNTGVPFQPFARNPQIRLTQKVGNLQVIGALLAQRDYASRGEKGAASEYLRNSNIPDVHIQFHYGKDNYVFGIGVAFKTIVPRLYSEIKTAEVPVYITTLNMADSTAVTVLDSITPGTSKKYKVDEKVSGLSFIVFGKIKLEPATIKLGGVLGQNIPDVLQASGFGVTSVIDTITGEQEYAPISNFSFWTDIHGNSTKIQPGIFIGYSKNLGAKEDITGSIYGLGTDIASMYRISPRIVINSGKFRFASEVEYSVAEFGSDYDAKGIPTSTKQVSNLRLLLSTYLFF